MLLPSLLLARSLFFYLHLRYATTRTIVHSIQPLAQLRVGQRTADGAATAGAAASSWIRTMSARFHYRN